ncbi:uncharacterized protein TNCV_2099441 [Trichonephila clavipes]|nr:uncharacterized protein TNCV_2099441 [Trichonephila clavipes]
MGMGCPFHCSGDRATSTVPTSNKASSKETTFSRQKIGENPKLCSLSEEHQDENESEEENLSLKTLTTAVKVLTSPPGSTPNCLPDKQEKELDFEVLC